LIGEVHQTDEGPAFTQHLQGQVGPFVAKLGERPDGHVDAVPFDQARLDHQERRRGWTCWRQAGDRVRVQVGGPVLVVAEVTPESATELRLADGGPIWVTIKATEVEVYPDIAPGRSYLP